MAIVIFVPIINSIITLIELNLKMENIFIYVIAKYLKNNGSNTLLSNELINHHFSSKTNLFCILYKYLK